jgi:NADH/NAD ratio-sensing transcriptional regulator Rex
LGNNPSGKVPVPTLERMATYLRYLLDLEQDHVETIASSDVEELAIMWRSYRIVSQKS